MTQEDQVFVANVVVTNLIGETMALNVISWPIGATMESSAITKIYKYIGLHEGHHFIPKAMEVHNTAGHDMDHFIKECAHLSHDRWLRGHLSLSFAFNFLGNLLVLFFNVI